MRTRAPPQLRPAASDPACPDLRAAGVPPPPEATGIGIGTDTGTGTDIDMDTGLGADMWVPISHR
ncbi:hypothetical protein OHS59_42455 [Streptomyces sp. NBC_00414]|uniref:hypothetical protein n=1 Tax=Streptomyces sp. NBC_00414 TaxID=2975739 RepID=UPI002E1A1A4D